MILGVGMHDRPLLGSPPVHNDPPPRPDPPVQGVVVNPPRDSRVAVRVEIVSEPQEARPREDATAAASPPPYDPWNNSSLFTAVYAAAATAVEAQPMAAARFGAPDARLAASAYRAHADWQNSEPASSSSSSTPRLSVRA